MCPASLNGNPGSDITVHIEIYQNKHQTKYSNPEEAKEMHGFKYNTSFSSKHRVKVTE